MFKVSEVGFGGTVGGDGAGEAWSYTSTVAGVEWTTYVYPVYMPERFSDWAERDAGNDWDVETFSMSEDNVGEYQWLTLNGCEDEDAAKEVAHSEAVRLRDLDIYLISRITPRSN